MTTLDEAPETTTQARPRRGLTNLLLLSAGIALAALIVLLAYTLRHQDSWWQVDFGVYWFAGDTVLKGVDLYQLTTPDTHLYFIYTPFAALFFAPLSIFPTVVAGYLWAGLEALFLTATIWIVLDAVGLKKRAQRAVLTVVLTAGALLLGPVDWNLSLGQVNILLMLLVLVDLLRGNGKRWQGVGIGLAAGIKLIPLIYIAYLAFTGRVRAAATAFGVFAGTVLLGFLMAPAASAGYWFGPGMAADRIGAPQGPFNGSLRGVFARLLGSPDIINLTWLAIAAVVGLAGLVAAIALHRSGYTLRGVLVCALTALLVSPISWIPHWVWIVPVLIVIGSFAVQKRSVSWGLAFVATAVVFGLRLWFWIVPLEAFFPFSPYNLNMPAATQLAVDGFPIVALVLILALSVPLLRRRGGPSPAAVAPHERIDEPAPALAGRS
ncbi:glycosyltransferase 87 family protein [Actinophytocola sp.]|jgi:alpha-1,2-mannosyltransferase|uniref:glycosyltransferase 87 family protein n=1 Tax=Actinophytocola sp. TaxID=1872138 RepID=UPI002EDA8ED0